MTEFLATNSLYIVLLVVLVVWLGIFFYLYRIDKRLVRLERKTEKSSVGSQQGRA